MTCQAKVNVKAEPLLWLLERSDDVVVVCCLLFVVCCLLFVVCCLLFVVCCLLFVVCCLLLVVAVAAGGGVWDELCCFTELCCYSAWVVLYFVVLSVQYCIAICV